ncbi:molybdenum cofactor guanylyltransferase MobA [Actibacterium sp. XHP0104]|uniref:molybdenum cofactor guanylyltransferase MobA n=1 Tax=Actibacterium sp. XHP0104 TaxID=2984335 RepID=UPI0021E96855|nr:molybdenum cofactor guanylyltransferase MobA [Actibacterium sp. XHP0104]MCV2883037.1 molybdenum cofactor guanylyltransferase MobA [Actibacterium sp. XHP0104]
MMQPYGVILAGGRSTRMGGQDKATLRLAGRPMLAHVRDRIEPQVAGLAISAGPDPARFADAGLPALADAGDQGPLAGILAGLDWVADQGGAHMVSVAVDTPFFPCDLVPRLLLASEGAAPIAMAASDGRLHPVFALWPVALRDDLRAALGEGQRKVRHWAQGHGIAQADFAVSGVDPFFNLNTPQDLARAEALLA